METVDQQDRRHCETNGTMSISETGGIVKTMETWVE